MSLKRLLILALPFVALVGCDSNPTNAPTAAEIKNSDERRAAAIDADPSLSQAQKTSMKQHLGLAGGPSGESSKSR